MNELELQRKVTKLESNATVRKLTAGGFLLFPLRDALPAADPQYAYQAVALRNVPGTSAGKVYVCLPSSASPAVYSWVEVASG